MSKKILFTDEQVQEMRSLYNSQLGMKEIGKRFNCCEEIINRLFKLHNIEKRSNEQARRIGRGVLNFKEDAFDLLTPDTLYWIGFLYADGHIAKEGRDGNNVSVNLSEKDIDHLHKLNIFLGGGVTVREVTNKNMDQLMSSLPGRKNFDGKMFRLAFNCTRIHTRLKELGFTHNKTYILTPHELLRCSRDFWRGVIDGDGWLCFRTIKLIVKDNYRSPILGVCGTKETVQEFLNFINASGILTNSSIKKDKRRNVHSVDLHSKTAIKIANLLYDNATTYLDRKYQKYQEFIAGNENSCTLVSNQ